MGPCFRVARVLCGSHVGQQLHCVLLCVRALCILQDLLHSAAAWMPASGTAALKQLLVPSPLMTSLPSLELPRRQLTGADAQGAAGVVPPGPAWPMFYCVQVRGIT